jgi:pimeloyl-ACP methyl ester carboxylesterase
MATAEEWTMVPTAAGELRALVHVPIDARGPLPGVVLVDGSGDGTCEDWGEWPERFLDRGAVVLTHDKPGCGGSPGDWTMQSFTDRSHESLAALQVLRSHPAVVGQPAGFVGFSQGGWVALLAATIEPILVNFVVSISGPGVSPYAQERYRIERELRAERSSTDDLKQALEWIDERAARLLAGEEVADVLADQELLSDRPWYQPATEHFDNPFALGFLARNLDFDPVPVLKRMSCPVLALFGADDTLVPVPKSVVAYATHLPELTGNPHGIAVFPGADHGLFTAGRDPAIARTDQLAPGFLSIVEGFIRDAAQHHRASTESAAA